MGRVLCHQGRGAAAELFFGLVVEEAAAVVQTHEAALVGEGADHLVSEVAAVGCEGTAVGVAGRKGAGGVLHNVPEALVGQVAHICDDVQTLHLSQELKALFFQARLGIGGAPEQYPPGIFP